jgi:hypothetical protein
MSNSTTRTHRSSSPLMRCFLFVRSCELLTCYGPRFNLAARFNPTQTVAMRILGVLSVTATLGFGLYFMYLQGRVIPVSGRPREQITLTGVKSDLMQIGQGERMYVSQNGKCIPLDELISSGSLAMSRTERDGYAYSIDCNGADFTVTAKHPEPPDGGARYPTLTLDSRMEIAQSF